MHCLLQVGQENLGGLEAAKMGMRESLLANVYKGKMESGCLTATQTGWQSDKRHWLLMPSLTQRESQTCDLDKFLPSH